MKDQMTFLKTTGSSKHEAKIFILPVSHYAITAIYTTEIFGGLCKKHNATEIH